MKAMIWKEWRENLKWGVLVFLSLGLATIYATTQGFNSQQTPSPNLFEATAPLTMFLVPIFAGVLGIVQVGSELRRDQWAFLLHRPVSRSVLFGGKAVAGLSIYFAATFTPMLLLALWMQSPGAIAAPFDWRLILAPLANILAGIAWYFAGMLTAVRPARWYGSRAVGFALAIGVLMAANLAIEFWQAALAAIFGAAMLGFAAWGSFLTGGTYNRQPKLAKIGLGVTMLLSIAIVVGTATAFVVSSIAQHQRAALFAGQRNGRSANYGIDTTGRVLLYKFDERGNISAADLQGRLVPKSKAGYEMLERSTLLSSYEPYENRNFRAASRYYLPMTPSHSLADARPQWFWVKSERRLVAYSLRTKRRIGSMGPQGFVPVESGAAAPFPEPILPISSRSGSWPNTFQDQKTQILRFPHSLFLWNVEEQRVSRFYTARSAQPIQGVGVLQPYADPMESGVAVVDQNLICVYGKNFRPLFATPVEPQNPKPSLLSISATAKNDRIFLWYGSEFFFETAAGVKPPLWHISKFSARGEALEKIQLPALDGYASSPNQHSFWYETAAPIVEVPPVLMGAVAAYGKYQELTHPNRFHNGSNRELELWFLASLPLGALCAALAFLVAKRADLAPRTLIGWMIGTFVLGLFGLLLLLSLHEWPGRLPCAVCGKKRDLSRENCQHCGAPFPEPPFDETAIFDDPIAAADTADWNRIREAV